MSVPDTTDALNTWQSSTLRSRLVVLLCIMLLPFILFSAYKAWTITAQLEQEAHREGLLRAQSVAATVEDYFLSTSDLLKAIASNRDLRSGDYEESDRWLQEMLSNYPHYSNIIFVDNTGDIRAAGRHSADTKGVVNVADTVYFRRAMSVDDVAIGDFMYGKISGAPVVHVCYPVYGWNSERIGFVAAAMHLNRVQDRLMQEIVPAHTTIAVISADGTMIARNRDPETWVGMDVTESMRVANMREQREGADRLTMPDGTKKVCGFTAIASVPWFVRVGVDRSHIMVQVGKELATHFGVFIPLLVVAILGWVWIGRDLDRLHKHTEQLSLTDPLTGVWNVRKLEDDLRLEMQRARRTRSPASFAMVDIDDFKQFNDTYGHQAGDAALQRMAGAIASALRETDTVYRYGGEEFSILLPGADSVAVHEVATRVRQAIERVGHPVGADLRTGHLTASIGVATFPDDAEQPADIIRCADLALYKAKASGKNRVVPCSAVTAAFEHS